MAAKQLEVNTDKLNTDGQQIAQLIKSMESQLEQMKTAVNAMNNMWEGSAKNAFVNAFDSDQRMAAEVVKNLKATNTYETNAKKMYDDCEKRIASIIAEIKV